MARFGNAFVCIFRFGLLAILLLILSGWPVLAGSDLEEPICLAEPFNLSKSEIPVLERQALKGSPEAAFRLSLFHEMIKLNYKEAMFWAQIAAENNHPVAQHNFGFMLAEDPDPRNRQRARFWLQRAADNGNEAAIKKLKKLPADPE
jgi:hypothetical protein